jgi:hypothetical protein
MQNNYNEFARNTTIAIPLEDHGWLRAGGRFVHSNGGEKSDIEARIYQIKAQIEETTSDYDRDTLREDWPSSRAAAAACRNAFSAQAPWFHRFHSPALTVPHDFGRALHYDRRRISRLRRLT